MSEEGGMSSQLKCKKHYHELMYMSWAISINYHSYYECIYCHRIIIDETKLDALKKQLEIANTAYSDLVNHIIKELLEFKIGVLCIVAYICQ